MTLPDEQSLPRIETMTVRLEHFSTVSESNTREHWTVKYRRARQQRNLVFRWLRATTPRQFWQLPMHITLVRIAPRLLDDDNLCGALKAVRDGVADVLAGKYGAGQDRHPDLTWGYQQRRGAVREYGVDIVCLPGGAA